MGSKYIIREFNEAIAQILISIEGLPGDIAIDLPLDENNNVPTGEALDNYIEPFIPYEWLKRIEQCKRPISNAGEIRGLVVPYPEPEQELVSNPEIAGGVATLSSITV